MIDWLSSFLVADKYADYIRLAAQEEEVTSEWFCKMFGNDATIKARADCISAIQRILDKDTHIITKCGDILKLLGIKGVLDGVECEEDIIPGIISVISNQGDQDIYVGTIHSSKGLEYDSVYVMGVNDTSFRLMSEEMNNLYYVALTRAKNHLTVFMR